MEWIRIWLNTALNNFWLSIRFVGVRIINLFAQMNANENNSELNFTNEEIAAVNSWKYVSVYEGY